MHYTKSTIEFYDGFVGSQQQTGINDRIYLLYKRMLRLGLNSKSNVLELGCGIGALSYLLAKTITKGRVDAVDISPESIAFAKQKIKHPQFIITAGDVVHHQTKLPSINFITLFDVIEHIPNIDKAFSKLNSLLTDDGVIIMVTPNHNSLQRKLLGKRWFQYKPIEHIQYFDRKSLNTFAERNGLKIVYQTNCGQYADTRFLINRLNYYHFTFLAKLFNKIFGILRVKNKFFYTDTGSLFVVLKRK